MICMRTITRRILKLAHTAQIATLHIAHPARAHVISMQLFVAGSQ